MDNSKRENTESLHLPTGHLCSINVFRIRICCTWCSESCKKLKVSPRLYTQVRTEVTRYPVTVFLTHFDLWQPFSAVVHL